MSELKDAWKQTGKSFILAINDLGISLSQSAKLGIDKAVEWARKDNPHYEATQGVEVPTPEDDAKADTPKEAAAEPEKPAQDSEPTDTAE